MLWMTDLTFFITWYWQRHKGVNILPMRIIMQRPNDEVIHVISRQLYIPDTIPLHHHSS